MFPFHLVQFANTEFLLMKTHRVLTDRANSSKHALSQKPGVFIVRPLTHMKTKQIQFTVLEITTSKNSLRNLRFHGGPFELVNLQISTTAFLFKAII